MLTLIWIGNEILVTWTWNVHVTLNGYEILNGCSMNDENCNKIPNINILRFVTFVYCFRVLTVSENVYVENGNGNEMNVMMSVIVHDLKFFQKLLIIDSAIIIVFPELDLKVIEKILTSTTIFD